MSPEGQHLLWRIMQVLVPEGVDPRIAGTGDLILDGVTLSLRVDERGGLFVACAEVGYPGAGRKSTAYRQALRAQFAAPAPWTLAAALHPQRHCLLLSGCAPLGTSARDGDVEQAASLVCRMVACTLAWRAEMADG